MVWSYQNADCSLRRKTYCVIIFGTHAFPITDRSFLYASPRLWNQLPASVRQPRTNLSNSDSPSPTSCTSSISSIDSPLSSPITPSLFHSRLITVLSCKSFPPQPFLFFAGTDCRRTDRPTSEHIRFLLFNFFFFFPTFYYSDLFCSHIQPRDVVRVLTVVIFPRFKLHLTFFSLQRILYL